jgi:VanZ family protein
LTRRVAEAMARPLARLILAWAPAVAWAATIWTVSSMSAPTFVPVDEFPLADKGVHVGVFALLGAFTAHGLITAHRSLPRAFALGALLAAAWGGVDELHQRFVPGRDADLLDVVADAAGALFGSAARVMLAATRRRRARAASDDAGAPAP